MAPKTELELVAKQYTAWCYPPPVPDLAAHVRDGTFDASDPSLFRRRLWPRQTEPDDLDVLIAGCGTYQAALYAFTNPQCRVVGVDLSETSLQHELYLKERHGLANLSVCRMNLLDAASLGRTFDYVVSTGVLHHLPDPEAGLVALRSVLRANGVLSLMLYGSYTRLGVQMLAQAFRRTALGQDGASLDVVKATLNGLPPWHHARSYLGTAPDLGYDSGLVDTFLHPSEHFYAVEGVLDLVRRAKLAFQGWLEPGYYALQDALPSTHPLRLRASKLPVEEQWAVVELVSQRIGCHRFLACHPERPARDYRPDFHTDAALAYAPALFHPAQLDARNVVSRLWQKAQLTPAEAAWVRSADGRTSIRAIAAANKASPRDVRRLFGELHERGFVVCADRGEPPPLKRGRCAQGRRVRRRHFVYPGASSTPAAGCPPPAAMTPERTGQMFEDWGRWVFRHRRATLIVSRIVLLASLVLVARGGRSRRRRSTG